ncbi:MAG: hypothetical protein R3C10_25690 [Pirellulales bacterium]
MTGSKRLVSSAAACAVTFLLAAATVAQQPQQSLQSPNAQAPPRQTAVPQSYLPPASMYAGYGGYPINYQARASTPAQASMDGMANVISSKGSYNLQTSEAAINMTAAQSQEIANRQQATDTYFSMRATNKAARAAEAGPRPTMEQIERMAKEGDPSQLTSNQLDHTTGKLNWPSYLQIDSFAGDRAKVDDAFAKLATHGGLTYQDRMAVDQTIDGMEKELKANIRAVPTQDYIDCHTFLTGLKTAAAQNG